MRRAILLSLLALQVTILCLVLLISRDLLPTTVPTKEAIGFLATILILTSVGVLWNLTDKPYQDCRRLSWLSIARYVVPRSYREAFLGDLNEDRAEMRRLGVPRWKIAIISAGQILLAVALRRGAGPRAQPTSEDPAVRQVRDGE